MKRQDETATLAERLRQAGLRVTESRLAILAEMQRNRTHPGAWDLHRRLRAAHPSLSVSTVYQTLEALAKVGLVKRVPARDGRLRVDGAWADHDHAICRACGRVFDVQPVEMRPQPVPEGLPRGVKLIGSRVEFEVLCATCQRA